jgi:hypothetical protein
MSERRPGPRIGASVEEKRRGGPAHEQRRRARFPPVPQTLIAISPEELETIIARAVRRALHAATDGEMIPQGRSPLGPRRHCEAVKRRLAAGQPGAAKVGRRYLLSEAALEEELQRSGARQTPPAGAACNDAAARLRRELGL